MTTKPIYKAKDDSEHSTAKAEIAARDAPSPEQPAAEQQPREKLTKIEQVESWGKHALDVRIDSKWVHFHTDYYPVVEHMEKRINALVHAPDLTRQMAERDAEIGRLRAQIERANQEDEILCNKLTDNATKIDQGIKRLKQQLAETQRQLEAAVERASVFQNELTTTRKLLDVARESYEALRSAREQAEAACAAYRNFLESALQWHDFQADIPGTLVSRNGERLREWLADNKAESVGQVWLEAIAAEKSAREQAEAKLAEAESCYERHARRWGDIAGIAAEHLADTKKKLEATEAELTKLRAETQVVRGPAKLPESPAGWRVYTECYCDPAGAEIDDMQVALRLPESEGG